MFRVILVVSCVAVLFAAPEVQGRKEVPYGRWKKQQVRVIDRTSEGLSGLIADAVADYNALGSGWPRLIYERGPFTNECSDLAPVKGAIVVCDRSTDMKRCHISYDGGCTVIRRENGIIKHVRMQLRLDRWDSDFEEGIAAHEMGHALGLPHSKHADSATSRTTLNVDPTARDAARLRQLYRRH